MPGLLQDGLDRVPGDDDPRPNLEPLVSQPPGDALQVGFRLLPVREVARPAVTRRRLVSTTRQEAAPCVHQLGQGHGLVQHLLGQARAVQGDQDLIRRVPGRSHDLTRPHQQDRDRGQPYQLVRHAASPKRLRGPRPWVAITIRSALSSCTAQGSVRHRLGNHRRAARHARGDRVADREVTHWAVASRSRRSCCLHSASRSGSNGDQRRRWGPPGRTVGAGTSTRSSRALARHAMLSASGSALFGE